MQAYDFEDITDGQVNARRNLFMGVWAGRQLGLNSDAMQDYVTSVMAADHEEPGPYCVIRKIHSDFEANGKPYCEADLMQQLIAFERQARSELCATD